jgi:hypothetical protein
VNGILYWIGVALTLVNIFNMLRILRMIRENDRKIAAKEAEIAAKEAEIAAIDRRMEALLAREDEYWNA